MEDSSNSDSYAKRQLQRVQKSLAEAVENINKYKEQEAKVNEEKKSQQERITALEAENSQLLLERNALNENLPVMQKTVSDIETYKEKIQSLESENVALRQSKDEIEVLRQNLASETNPIKEKVQQLETENKELRKQNDSELNMHKEEIKKLEEKYDHELHRNNDLKAEKENLQNICTENQSEIKRLEKRNDDLEKRIKELGVESQNSQSKEFEALQIKYNDQVDITTKQCIELNDANDAVLTYKKQAEESENTCELMRSQIEELSASLAQLKSSFNQAEAEATELMIEKDKFEEENNELKRTVEELTTRKDELESSVKYLKDQIEELNIDINDLQGRNVQLEADKASKMNDVAEFLAKLKAAKVIESQQKIQILEQGEETRRDGESENLFKDVVIKNNDEAVLPFLKQIQEIFNIRASKQETSLLIQSSLECIKDSLVLTYPERLEYLSGRRVLMIRLEHNPFLYLAVMTELEENKVFFFYSCEDNKELSKCQFLTGRVTNCKEDQDKSIRRKLEVSALPLDIKIVQIFVEKVKGLSLTLLPKAQRKNLYQAATNPVAVVQPQQPVVQVAALNASTSAERPKPKIRIVEFSGPKHF